jgi:hypothetical protein
MIGFDHALYRLGLRDRFWIRAGQLFAIFGLGVWVARSVIYRLPAGAGCSLVALYAMLFLYHRNYDAVVLSLPLVYCTGRARSETGAARLLFATCATGMIAVLNMRTNVLTEIAQSSIRQGMAGRLVQAMVLPASTWLVLGTMGALVWAEYRANRRPSRAGKT